MDEDQKKNIRNLLTEIEDRPIFFRYRAYRCNPITDLEKKFPENSVQGLSQDNHWFRMIDNDHIDDEIRSLTKALGLLVSLKEMLKNKAEESRS